MTQVGEAVKPGEFIAPERHDKSICPWHEEPEGKAGQLDPQEADEDAFGELPANLGKKLGNNLNTSGVPGHSKEPLARGGGYMTVVIKFIKASRRPYMAKGKKKFVQLYKPEDRPKSKQDDEDWEYPVQFAPHHLIPGNESLKNNPILAYMGDAGSIPGEYKTAGVQSQVEKGYIGYDVNAATNGVWLPSPYALSNSNKWPADAGIEALKKRRRTKELDELIRESEAFKMAFAAATIDDAGDGQLQFHMRHADYSKDVRGILGAMATKLWWLSTKGCPLETKKTKNGGKCDPPPYGLVDRLNVLSSHLRTLVTGPLWRPNLYTDGLTAEYAKDLKKTKKVGRFKKVI